MDLRNKPPQVVHITRDERAVVVRAWEAIVAAKREIDSPVALQAAIRLCKVQPLGSPADYAKHFIAEGAPITLDTFLTAIEEEKQRFVAQTANESLALSESFSALGGDTAAGKHIQRKNLAALGEAFGIQIDSEIADPDDDEHTDGVSFDEFKRLLEDNNTGGRGGKLLKKSDVLRICLSTGWSRKDAASLAEDLDSGGVKSDKIADQIQQKERFIALFSTTSKLTKQLAGERNAACPTDNVASLRYLVHLCSVAKQLEKEQAGIKKWVTQGGFGEEVQQQGEQNQKRAFKERSNHPALRKQRHHDRVRETLAARQQQCPALFSKKSRLVYDFPLIDAEKPSLKNAASVRKILRSNDGVGCWRNAAVVRKKRPQTASTGGPLTLKDALNTKVTKRMVIHPVAAQYKALHARPMTADEARLRLGIQTEADPPSKVFEIEEWQTWMQDTAQPTFTVPYSNRFTLPEGIVEQSNNIAAEERVVPHPPTGTPRPNKRGSFPKKTERGGVEGGGGGGGAGCFVLPQSDREKVNKRLAKFGANGKPRSLAERKLYDHYFGFIAPPRYAAEEMVKGSNSEFHGLMEFVPRIGPIVSSKSASYEDRAQLAEEEVPQEEVSILQQPRYKINTNTTKSFSFLKKRKNLFCSNPACTSG